MSETKTVVAAPEPPFTPEYLLYVAENTLLPVDTKKRTALCELTYWLGKPDGYIAPPPIQDPSATAARQDEPQTGTSSVPANLPPSALLGFALAVNGATAKRLDDASRVQEKP